MSEQSREHDPDYERRRREAKKRRRARKRRIAIIKRLAVLGVLLLALVLCIVIGLKLLNKDRGVQDTPSTAESADSVVSESTDSGASSESGTTEAVTPSVPVPGSKEEALAKASKLALQYDYDSAVATLQAWSDQNDGDIKAAIADYTAQRDACVAVDVSTVPHIFFHSLINDSRGFIVSDQVSEGRVIANNAAMATVDEFNHVINQMYEAGFVMISLDDMVIKNADGTFSKNTGLKLPAGKKAFIMSEDDLSYYHSYGENGAQGYANRLVLDENGKVKCEYVNPQGETLIGDYDMVPWIDTFVKEHPDFSYHGHKGIIALTGYNGILGYRTDIAYKTRENLDSFQQAWFDQHPDFDEAAYNKECEDAKAVAAAMKATGWEFASHTWGHINVGQKSLEGIQTDTEKWLNYVSPLIGGTDVIIFAFGADLGDWTGYTTDNEKFNYLKNQGFDIYCNVDSTQYWVQFGSDVANGGQYMRQGRRNLDGYRMYYNPEMVEDLFDARAILDPARPTPVPPM